MRTTVNHTKTILLIDDDEDDCLFLSHALAAVSNNITLSCLHDVNNLFETLLETIDVNKPSLIFIDFYMPKRNGLDLLRLIKKHPDYKHIPVVMWSTSCIRSNVAAAYREGAQAFVQKPSSFNQFVQELRAILKQQSIEFQQAIYAAN
jgi:CheY-like chemotaxis protein